MTNFKIIVTTTFGLESVVKKELFALGYKELKVEDGRIELDGTANDICKLNIRLRCADRVYLKVGEFEATSFEELFQNTKKLNWSDILPEDAIFPVSKISSIKSKLFSKSDSQAIIKKAIVENLKEKYNKDIFPETGSQYSIQVQIKKDIVTISIDTSGEALHKRGYRSKQNSAPIKETLAAAMIMLSGWDRNKTTLFDPFCGTGTILIEAAMMAKNISPGANRNFVSENWNIIPEESWVEERDTAYNDEIEDIDIKFFGSDTSRLTLETARENAEEAGVGNCISFIRKDFRNVHLDDYTGYIITNPPYGERLEDKNSVKELYRDLGKRVMSDLKKWKTFVITSNEDFQKDFGKKADKNRKLYNGGLKSYFYQYFN